MDVEDVFEKWNDSEMMDMEEIKSVVGCEKERSKKMRERQRQRWRNELS